MTTLAEPRPTDTPKRERMRLAKAELLLWLAVKAADWAGQVDDRPGAPTRPFAEWSPDDPFRKMAETYALTGADLGRILDRIGDELERRAERAGYAETWTDL